MLESNADEQSSTLREALDKAAEQALRAGQIIRRLRDFVARGESERRVENITKLMEEASALALVGAKDHAIRVRFRFDAIAESVLSRQNSDPAVLLNLMRNRCRSHARQPESGALAGLDRRGQRYGTDFGRRHRCGNSARRVVHSSFSHSSRPSSRGWEWVFPFAEPSLNLMAGKSGLNPTQAGETVFNFTLKTVRKEEVGDAV